MTKKAAGPISFVIPVYNEKETLVELLDGIVDNVTQITDDYEVIFIDDGSTDGSSEILEQCCRTNNRARLISFSKNSGKAAALDFGFKAAQGDIVITLDADFQDDPVEIPRFIDKILEGYDLVSGWKINRKDPWHKVLPSKIFNFVTRTCFSVPLNDINSGFKAYRKTILDRVSVYGELHRYIPIIINGHGARIAEIPVRHNPRRFGKSKYGWGRFLKGFLDLVTIFVTTRFMKRPMHFFGVLGIVCSSVGGLFLTYLAVLWFLGYRPIGNRPLLFYSMLLFIFGFQLLSLGIIGELLVYLNQSDGKPIVVRRLGFPDEATSFPSEKERS